ncbi:cyclase family protein [Paludibaculum fermentans]|uniref:Cyclase family protein n=1 Tax=Paludibaculum fermentans TaxID=1473598 RepID=A0A7S7NNE9_PALFE|nr:cyclase family protein [Paludibaculum fermentans]QOY86339.1 cyclase family protein [Paludibaculum fermentans]
MPRFIELSHPIIEGMKTFPGLPGPQAVLLFDHAGSRRKYKNQSEFLIASLHLCGNTGTYVDSPYHRFPDAPDLSELPLDRLADLEIVKVDARQNLGRGIGPHLFQDLDLQGKAVLVQTGWDQHWNKEEYFEPNPFLNEDACLYLVEAGAVFVGIDSVNIDDMGDLRRPAHTVLLGNGIPICEHMTNLEAVATNEGRLHAVPIAWKGGATFPVRAYIVLPE